MTVGAWFDADERRVVAAALDAQVPGASELGAVDYVERLLTALEHDPPTIWAAPAISGTAWLELGPWERAAWTSRIAGWREAYARVVAGTATEADTRMLHDHACEATYGDPAYGGNQGEGGWRQIDFPSPMFPPERAPA